MSMHPTTRAAVLAAIRAELQADPTARGYAGKTAAEILDLLNAPLVTAAPVKHRHVKKSDVTGYLHARLVLVPLEEWAASAPPSRVRTIAKSLLGVLASDVHEFLTGNDESRIRVLGMFAELTEEPATGVTQEHYAAISAMTAAPAGPDTIEAPRWAVLIDGLSAEPGHAGPPNTATLDLIEEALDGNR